MKTKIVTPIESLRFVSVIFVILFHFNNHYFPNGYLGVDIFFSISGYVITKSLESHEINFRQILIFWGRRIMRLLPSLYFVLIVCFTFSIIYDPPHITKQLGQALTATTLNATNVLYYYTIDYFNDFHNHGPFLHFWSLSLEEQFYLTFPFLFLIRRNNFKIRLFAILFIFSFSSWFYINLSNPQAGFYLPFNRFWQLYLGALIALYQKQNIGNFKVLIISFILLLILLSIQIFNKSNSTILISFLTSIILFNANVKETFFDNKTLILLGSSTYVIYLWHQPILYYSQIWIDQNHIRIFIELILLISFSLFTIILIEKKFRKEDSFLGYFSVFSCTILISFWGIKASFSDGFFNFKAKFWNIENLTNEKEKTFYKKQTYLNNLISTDIYPIDSSILIIGDSKGEDLLVSLAITSTKPNNLKYLFIKLQTWDYNDTNSSEYLTIKKILSAKKTKYVVFTNTWKSIHNKRCAEYINKIATNKNYRTIVLSTSNFKDVSSLAFESKRKNLSSSEQQNLLLKSLRMDWYSQSQNLKKQLNLLDVVWLNKEKAFNYEGKSKLISSNGHLRIFDTGHVTLEGAEILGNWIRKELNI